MGQYICSPQGNPAYEHDVEAELVPSENVDADTAHDTPGDGPLRATLLNAISPMDAVVEAPRPDRKTDTTQSSTALLTSADKKAKRTTGRSTTVLKKNRTTSDQQKSCTAYGHSGEPQLYEEALSSARRTHVEPTPNTSHMDTASKGDASDTQQQGSKEKQGVTGTRQSAIPPASAGLACREIPAAAVHGSHHHSTTSATVSQPTAPHATTVTAGAAVSSTSSHQDVDERQARRALRRAARLRAALRRTWGCSCSVFGVMLALAAAIASVAFKSAEQRAHLLRVLDPPHFTANLSGPPHLSLPNDTLNDEPLSVSKKYVGSVAA